MTNLKTANIGFNRFCGPAVLSILTGRNTDDCARVISSVNGQYSVSGVYMHDLLRSAQRMGFDYKTEFRTGSLYRTLASIIKQEGMYIVAITGHFVCVEVNDGKIYFCDNHTKEPIPAASSARLMQEVQQIARVWKNPNYTEPVPEPKVTTISEEYTEALNLIHMARVARNHLTELGMPAEEWSFSMQIAKQTLNRLYIFLLGNERDEVKKLMDETEWF